MSDERQTSTVAGVRTSAIDETTPDIFPEAVAPLAVGTQVGRYIVLEEVGSGAMGVVYAAFDPELNRKVALKVIHAAEARTPLAREAQSRLLREAQALARLDHPNVVMVHDVGRFGGRVFLAMEFLAGQTLSQWLDSDEHRWRDVLSVFDKAGRGLAAAHERGLVHRDFKPDNVMVTRDERVVVMDFGLARPGDAVTDESNSGGDHDISWGFDAQGSRVTLAGLTPGTPAYMSPEQHNQVATDHRTDQFSFCVSLYEGLYGRPPFDGNSIPAVAVSICTEEPREPPHETSVPRWLHRVVSKGLAKRPEDRFASMHALLESLGADPTRSWRRGGLVAATALVGVGAWGVVELDERRRVASCERAGERIGEAWNDDVGVQVKAALLATEVGYATSTWESVERLLSDYSDGWRAMKRELCARAEVRRELSTEQYGFASECLDSRKAGLSTLVGVLLEADDDTARHAVGAAAKLRRLQPCADTGGLDRALRPLGKAQPEIPLLRQRLEQALALKSANRFEEARAQTDAIIDRARTLGHEPLLVEAQTVRGEIDLASEDYPGAENHLETSFFGALAIDHDEIAAQAAISLVNAVGRFQARYDDGLQWSSHAEAALERLGGPTDLLWADLYSYRADIHTQRGDFDAARADHGRALEIRRATLGQQHTEVARSLEGIGQAYFAERRLDEAFEHLEEVLEIRQRAFGPDHPIVASSLNNLGVARFQRKHYDEARALLERSLEIRRAAYGDEHTVVSNTLTNLAEVLLAQGDRDGALRTLRQALSIREQILGPHHPNLAHSLNNIGGTLLGAGKVREAAAHLERARAIQRRALAPEHIDRVPVLWGLGRAKLQLDEFEEGVRLLDQALAIQEQAGSPALELGLSYFRFAQLLWTHGLDRRRAVSMAVKARETYSADSSMANELEEVERWLSAHAR